MFPISESERAELRAAAEQSLFETCTIYHSTGSSNDDYGQVSHTFETLEDVPCGIQLAQGEYQNERGQAVILSADAVLRVSLDQEIDVHDYVTVRDKSYAVDGVYDGLTVRRATLKLDQLPEAVG